MCIPSEELANDQQKANASSTTSSTNNLNTGANLDATNEMRDQASKQATNTTNNSTTVVKKQILRREYNEQDANSKVSGAWPKLYTRKTGLWFFIKFLKQNRYNRTVANDVKPKTYEEKSADYIKAKNRIFNNGNGNTASNYASNASSISSAPTSATQVKLYTNKTQHQTNNETPSKPSNSNLNKNTTTNTYSNSKNSTTSNKPQQQYTILNRTNTQLPKSKISSA